MSNGGMVHSLRNFCKKYNIYIYIHTCELLLEEAKYSVCDVFGFLNFQDGRCQVFLSFFVLQCFRK